MKEESINTYDQLVRAGGGVAIMPSTASTSRAAYVPATTWLIYRVGSDGREIQTDPQAAWYNYGRKAFSFMRFGGKQQALEVAKAWCLTEYGESGPWTRNRMHDYVPTRINKAFPLRCKP